MTPQTLKKVGPSTLIESPGDTEKGVPMLSNGTTKINEILEAAREYIFKGISVIPLKAKGKTPAIPAWKEYQTRLPTDAELVEWFADGKNNIAIVTGSISGLAVIDADDPEALEWCEENLPVTPTVETARGRHYYFKFKAGLKNSVKVNGLKLDIRAEGGYVAAPPSIHETGVIYSWHVGRSLDDIPLADFPTEILKQKDTAHPSTTTTGKAGNYGQAALISALSRLAGATEGERNSDLNKEAFSLGQLVAGGELDRGAVEAALTGTALSIGLKPAEARATIQSGLEAGAREPRTAPESGRSKPLSIATDIPSEWPEPSRLKVVSISELLQHDFPVLAYLLYPILHTQSLNMIHAWRGIGKTFFGLCLAYATASGGRFLKWHAEKPRGVLYLDGEMPGNSLQARLAGIIDSNENEPPPGFFQVLTPDLQAPGSMPDLSTPEGQAAIDALVTPDTALIVVDNLSCFLRSGRENESESWLPVQGWALRHRAAGRTVLFIHHSGKGGTQRGSSKKEDVLDLVLNLKRPIDYEPSQGACFEVVFEKSRHLTGADTTSFEATLSTDEHGKQSWIFRDVTETTFERVVSLANEGLSQADIAGELGINKSSVCRHIRKGKEQGKLSEKSKVA